MAKMTAMGTKFFAGLLLLVLTSLPHGSNAAPLNYCEPPARKATPFLLVQSSCQGNLQTRLYNTAGALANGNAQQMGATLGMLAVESGCGTNRSNVTQSTCEGQYNVRAGNSSAYGATQIISDTWQGLTRGGSPSANWMKQQLGGCGLTPQSGSLSDGARTQDAYVLGQFRAFRASLCGIPYCPSGQTCRSVPPPSNQQYWGAQVSVSMLAARAHDLPMQSFYQDQGITQRLNGLGTNPYGVIAYAGHNLGSGGGPRFLNALESNPNTSAAGVMSACAFHCNPGLYCAQGGRSSNRIQCGRATCTTCTQPLNVGQAAQRMHNTMYGSACVRNGMAALGQPVPFSPTGDGGVANSSNSMNALSGEAQLREIMGRGGAVGEMENDCMSGVSVDCNYSGDGNVTGAETPADEPTAPASGAAAPARGSPAGPSAAAPAASGTPASRAGATATRPAASSAASPSRASPQKAAQPARPAARQPAARQAAPAAARCVPNTAQVASLRDRLRVLNAQRTSANSACTAAANTRAGVGKGALPQSYYQVKAKCDTLASINSQIQAANTALAQAECRGR